MTVRRRAASGCCNQSNNISARHARAKERGVLVMAFAARTVRAVTHLDVSAEDCTTAADVLAECVSG